MGDLSTKTTPPAPAPAPGRNHPSSVGRGLTATAAVIVIIALCISLIGCEWMPPYQSLRKIRKSGELVVITRNNANCYYLYRDEPMGFEYELAKAFADHLGVRLKIKIAHQWNDLIPEVLSGRSALIAASMTATAPRKERIRFSDPYMTIRQHLIVHRDNVHIDAIEEIGERAVHVREGTSYQDRLQQHDGRPSSSVEPAAPPGEEGASSDERHQDRQCHRQMYDLRMEKQRFHEQILLPPSCVPDLRAGHRPNVIGA